MMDSPQGTRFLRQLLRHRQCPLLRNRAELAAALARTRAANQRQAPSRLPRMRAEQRREYATSGGAPKSEMEWQQRHAFPADRTAEYRQYPMVTADELRLRR